MSRDFKIPLCTHGYDGGWSMRSPALTDSLRAYTNPRAPVVRTPAVVTKIFLPLENPVNVDPERFACWGHDAKIIKSETHIQDSHGDQPVRGYQQGHSERQRSMR